MRTSLGASAFIASLALSACESGKTITLGEYAPDTALTGGVSAGGAITGGNSPTDGSAPMNEGGAPVVDPPEPRLPLAFDNVEVVAELATAEKNDNPTLTGDQLTLCFTSQRTGGTGDVDVYCAHRASDSDPFDAPIEITTVNSVGFESSSAIDLDGLTLWFGSDRAGGQGQMDIYRSTRPSRGDAWGAPELVPELNSEFDDIPRPTAMNGAVMPLGSRRTDDIYWTYLAEHSSGDAAFGAPSLLKELAPEGQGLVDAQLSEDGFLLVFTTTPADSAFGDLFAAERTSLTEPFSEPVALEGVNTEFDDRDPWLSPEGEVLYFSSDRTGEFDIYRARRIR